MDIKAQQISLFRGFVYYLVDSVDCARSPDSAQR